MGSRHLCAFALELDEKALIRREGVAGHCVFEVAICVAGGHQFGLIQRTGVNSPTRISRLTLAGFAPTFDDPRASRVVGNEQAQMGAIDAVPLS